jgi:hypothetical protein
MIGRRSHIGEKRMKKGWRILIVGVVLVGATAGWITYTYQDKLFHIKPVRERLLANLPLAGGNASFRDEVMSAKGNLCGEVRGVSGGERIGGRPGTNAGIMAIEADQWRRFIVVPSVPAFYVEGLAPWGLALDGKKIAVDLNDLSQERDELKEQYKLAASYDGIDAARTDREIEIKTIGEHFEASWAEFCPATPTAN